ncbi:cytochrome p450-like protein [Moniliophthora roreri]|nr:cytochrome p450-like protein [Moniliophthora roreri]
MGLPHHGKLNGDDTILAFGFSKRVCVSQRLAETTLWLAFASVLTCFIISKEKDANGQEIDISENYSDGPTFS